MDENRFPFTSNVECRLPQVCLGSFPTRPDPLAHLSPKGEGALPPLGSDPEGSCLAAELGGVWLSLHFLECLILFTWACFVSTETSNTFSEIRPELGVVAEHSFPWLCL